MLGYDMFWGWIDKISDYILKMSKHIEKGSSEDLSFYVYHTF